MAPRVKPKARRRSPGKRTTQPQTHPDDLVGADKPLCERDQLFVAGYLKSLHPERAALEAGFAASVAKTKAYQWVRNPQHKPNVYAAIRRGIEKTVRKIEVSRESVIEELAKLAFSNLMDYGQIGADGQFDLDMSATTRDQFAAVQEIQSRVVKTPGVKTAVKTPAEPTYERHTKIKLAGKREALVDLGRHLGVFKDEAAAGLTVSFTISGLLPAPEQS